MVPSSAFEPCSGPLRAPSTCRPKIAKGGMLPALRGRRGTRDRGPKLESPGPCGSVVDGGKVLAAERKEVVDRNRHLSPTLPRGLGLVLLVPASDCRRV